MKRAIAFLGFAVVLGAGSNLRAQVPLHTTVGFSTESYDFDPGLVFKRVFEYAVPVGVSVPLGRFGDLALSSGYAHVQLRTADRQQLRDQTISGILDSELRLSWNVIPDRLVAFATSAIPTGVQTVEQEELSILGALSSDIIGFSAPALGSGGSFGGGFGGAVPLSRSWSIGIGGTVRQPLSYTPVVGQLNRLKPGTDFRLRAGLEGSIGRRTYLRIATVFARQGKDAVGDSTRNGLGNRIVSYLTLSHRIGSSSLILYGFDVFRGSPQLEPTAAGTALMPRGNLIGSGLRLEIPVASRLSVTPRTEFRLSSQAQSQSKPTMWLAGESLRLGGDLRYQVTRKFSVVLQGSWMTGFLVQAFQHIGFTGARAALHTEWRP